MRTLFALFQDFCTRRLKEERRKDLMILANVLYIAGNPAWHDFARQALSIT